MINTRCSFSNLNKSVIRMSFFAVVWGDLIKLKKSDMGNTFDQESEFKENSDIFQTYRKGSFSMLFVCESEDFTWYWPILTFYVLIYALLVWFTTVKH